MFLYHDSTYAYVARAYIGPAYVVLAYVVCAHVTLELGQADLVSLGVRV